MTQYALIPKIQPLKHARQREGPVSSERPPRPPRFPRFPRFLSCSGARRNAPLALPLLLGYPASARSLYPRARAPSTLERAPALAGTGRLALPAPPPAPTRTPKPFTPTETPTPLAAPPRRPPLPAPRTPSPTCRHNSTAILHMCRCPDSALFARAYRAQVKGLGFRFEGLGFTQQLCLPQRIAFVSFHLCHCLNSRRACTISARSASVSTDLPLPLVSLLARVERVPLSLFSFLFCLFSSQRHATHPAQCCATKASYAAT